MAENNDRGPLATGPWIDLGKEGAYRTHPDGRIDKRTRRESPKLPEKPPRDKDGNLYMSKKLGGGDHGRFKA